MGANVPWIIAWDRTIFSLINQDFTSIVFDALMPLLSSFEIWLIPLGLAWVVWFFKTNRNGKIVALGCFLVVAATDQIAATLIKPIVGRERPCNVVPESRYYDADDKKFITTDRFGLTTYKSSPSFPSNHAANIAGQAVYWSYFYPQASPVFVVVSLAVGYSRIYLGHHWPLDVAAGFLLGIVVALGMAYPLKLWVIDDD